jgi:hypothetical protein
MRRGGVVASRLRGVECSGMVVASSGFVSTASALVSRM